MMSCSSGWRRRASKHVFTNSREGGGYVASNSGRDYLSDYSQARGISCAVESDLCPVSTNLLVMQMCGSVLLTQLGRSPDWSSKPSVVRHDLSRSSALNASVVCLLTSFPASERFPTQKRTSVVVLRFTHFGRPIMLIVEMPISSDGCLRDECLNAHWFLSLTDARGQDRGLATRLQREPSSHIAWLADAGRICCCGSSASGRKNAGHSPLDWMGTWGTLNSILGVRYLTR